MYIDSQAQFSNNQAITASAASTNIYDFGATPTGATTDAGPGRPLYLAGNIPQAFNNLTSLAVAVQTSNDPTFATGVNTLETTTLALAALGAGSPIPFQPVGQGFLRYVRLYYTVTGTAPTTGSVTAEFIETPQANAGVPEILTVP